MFKFTKILLIVGLLMPQVVCANNQQAVMHKTNVAVLSGIAAICYLNAIREGLCTTGFIGGAAKYRTQCAVISGILSLGSLGLGIAATVGAVKEFKKFKEESKK